MIKKLFFFVSAAFVLASCSPVSDKIVVKNSDSELAREKEMVEIKVSDLKADFQKRGYVLKNEEGNEVPYQLIKEGDKISSLIFQASVQADSFAIYKLEKGTPKEVRPRTSARFVPERDDDMAWENDMGGYRIYGPESGKKGNPSNGVDLWLKHSDDLILDKLYRDHLENGKSYHSDHGDGLDCYAVGRTLGAGGITPYTSKLWVGRSFDQYEVLENGPLRSKFRLIFDEVKVDSLSYKETITITLDAGNILNKAVVRYEGESIPMKLAGGIFLHDEKGAQYESEEEGVIGYAEDATGENGKPAGRDYVGVFMPGSDLATKIEDNQLLILSDYEVGTDFTYYFGGSWSEWKIKSDSDWFSSLCDFARSVNNPLEITVE